MARQARQFSEIGLYHIVFRGVNRCNLFEEKSDYEKFLSILKKVKVELCFDVYAYCLMSNHVHLFIHEKNLGDIVLIMKKILTHYAGWFNRKYDRSGTLIANRYKSECVNNDEYLFSLVKYIHQNPLKAGIVEKPENYKWSSYREYVGTEKEITCCQFLLDVLDEKGDNSIKRFIELHQVSDDEQFVPIDRKRKTDEQIHREIVKLLKGKEPNEIGKMNRDERNQTIKKLKERGLSIRQIERATGISRGIVAKC